VSDVYLAVTSCHHAVVLPYAAYLRVYEPLPAFGDADGRYWASYAASAARPRRGGALAAEHAGAIRRLIAAPVTLPPAADTGDAYVRWVDGVTYICPWQTRLRCWLGLSRLKATAPQLWSAAFPAGGPDPAVSGCSYRQAPTGSLRIHIQTSAWSVPAGWFVPFVPEERWLVLGADEPDAAECARPTAAVTRTLVYVTTMAQARMRVNGAAAAIGCGGKALASASVAGDAALRTLADLAQLRDWLTEFHPHALVELDYGGLVYLLDDTALRADESVAEMSAAVGALLRGEPELASAMFRRVTRRWHALQALERAS
jgi:hypothetical protein